MRKARWILAALLSAGIAWAADKPPAPNADEAATRKAGEAVELDKRYADPLHGFSLRPPAGTERRREFSASVIVTWTRRDEQTGAVAWTLAVQKATEGGRNVDPNSYAEALAKKLADDDNYKVESMSLGTIAGRPGIHFRGIKGGLVKLWQRQAWVLVSPGQAQPATAAATRGSAGETPATTRATNPRQFLILVVTGPQDMKDRLDRLLEDVLGTLEWIDPGKVLEQRKENIERGKELLRSVKDKQFAAALVAEPQWFLMQLKDEDIGCMVQTEAAARRDGMDGYEVRIWVMTHVAKDRPRLLRRALFTTADRSFERWEERLEIGSGKEIVRETEEGIKQADMIVCNITAAGRMVPQKKKLPQENYPEKFSLQEFYLSRAMGLLLPRLVDLGKPAAYSFATYNTTANNFDMRTFAIVGTEKVTANQARVDAVKATDQSAPDSEPATYLLDSKGMILRMTSSDGLVVEAMPKATVLQRWPKAETFAREVSGN